jgi:hypothetical protein
MVQVQQEPEEEEHIRREDEIHDDDDIDADGSLNTTDTESETDEENTNRFECSHHGFAMKCELADLRSSGTLCDVKIKVEDVSFQAHKLILMANSSFFSEMFSSANWVENHQDSVELFGIRATGFQKVLDFAYTGELVVDYTLIEHVLGAADHCEMESLVNLCEKFLKRKLDSDNRLEILHMAEFYKLRKLENEIIVSLVDKICSFKSKKERQRYVDISVKAVENILDTSIVNESRGLAIVEFIVQWVKYDLEKRLVYLPQLLGKSNVMFLDEEMIAIVAKMPHIITSSACQLILKDNEHYFSGAKTVDEATIEVRQSAAENGPCILNVANTLYCHLNTGRIGSIEALPDANTKYYGSATVGNMLYVCGGCSVYQQRSECTASKECYCYNPYLNQWSRIQDMQEGHCHFPVVEFQRCLYALGGVDSNSNISTTVEFYEPETNNWMLVFEASLPNPLFLHAAAVLEGNIYVSGGVEVRDRAPTASFISFCASTSAWETREKLRYGRSDHALVACKGKLFQFGGFGRTDDLEHYGLRNEDCDFYCPIADQWTSIKCDDLDFSLGYGIAACSIGNEIFITTSRRVRRKDCPSRGPRRCSGYRFFSFDPDTYAITETDQVETDVIFAGQSTSSVLYIPKRMVDHMALRGASI